MKMTNRQRADLVYLVRMWAEDGRSPVWRFSIESVADGSRRGLTSFDELRLFLEKDMSLEEERVWGKSDDQYLKSND